ncbi:MAG: lysylphosphatidylglycerol synthase transmembrane domain-containing protein [Ignavibacteriaceae bacterium]
MTNNGEKIIARHKNRDIFYFILKVSIAGFLIYYLTSKFIVLDFSIFSVKNLEFLILGIALTFLNLYLQYLKWRILCRDYFMIKEKGLVIKSLLTGIAAGIFTPARLGEFLGRGVIMKTLPMKEVMMTTIFEKLLNLFWILSIGLILLEIFAVRYFRLNLYFALPLTLVTAGGIYFLWRYIKTIQITNEKIEKYTARIPPVKKFLVNLNEVKNISFELKRRLFFMSLGLYLVFLIQYSFFVSSYMGGTDFLNYMWTAGLIIFTTSVIPSVSIGDLGIRESASIIFLGSFGYDQQTGFNASLLLFLFNIMLPSVFGLYYLLRGK